MASFNDAADASHTITLDAFLIDAVEEATGVDLADVSAVGYARLQRDSRTLVKVLAVLCGKPFREFAKVMSGQSLVDGREAVMEAAENFFPPNEWSEIRSNLEKSRTLKKAVADGKDLAELQELLTQVSPLFQAIENMPPEMKAGAKAEALRQIEAAGGDASDLERLEHLVSAGGQAVTPSNTATDLPANAELPPED